MEFERVHQHMAYLAELEEQAKDSFEPRILMDVKKKLLVFLEQRGETLIAEAKEYQGFSWLDLQGQKSIRRMFKPSVTSIVKQPTFHSVESLAIFKKMSCALIYAAKVRLTLSNANRGLLEEHIRAMRRDIQESRHLLDTFNLVEPIESLDGKIKKIEKDNHTVNKMVSRMFGGAVNSKKCCKAKIEDATHLLSLMEKYSVVLDNVRNEIQQYNSGLDLERCLNTATEKLYAKVQKLDQARAKIMQHGHILGIESRTIILRQTVMMAKMFVQDYIKSVRYLALSKVLN